MVVSKFNYKTALFDDGNSFGTTGQYLEIKGTAHITLDPNLEQNQAIKDINYVPTDDAGLVRFSTDFTLLKPLDPDKGNGRLLFDVPNRGRRIALNRLNQLEPPPDIAFGEIWAGDGWALKKGYSILSCGWQHDVPLDGEWLRINSPIPIRNGGETKGKGLCRMQAEGNTNEWPLSHAGHLINAPSDLNQEHALLSVKENFSEVAGLSIPREQWKFAKQLDGDLIPASDTIYYEDGFKAGHVYELVYQASGTPLTGIGLTAIRDIASYFRHDLKDDKDPLFCRTEKSIAIGFSLCGALLRQFLYMGLNQDEKARQVFDGVLSFIGGGRRSTANWSFAQLSAMEPPNTGLLYPFNDLPDDNPTGGTREGIMSKAIMDGSVPKTMYINSSAEYWMAQGSLVHMKIRGEDSEIPDDVRIYLMSGTQHVGFNLPLTNTNAGPLADTKAQTYFNVNDWKPLGRSALQNMDKWISEGTLPPESAYPKLSDGTAVQRESLRQRINKVVGVDLPNPLIPVRSFDFGHNQQPWATTKLPPEPGQYLPDYASDIDEDGNEVAGIKLPDVAVPLATYTGWHTRHKDMGGEGKQLLLSGSTIPFSRTRKERETRNDSRLSIQERYESKNHYLKLIEESAIELIENRMIVEEDLQLLIDSASEKYDAFMESDSLLPD